MSAQRFEATEDWDFLWVFYVERKLHKQPWATGKLFFCFCFMATAAVTLISYFVVTVEYIDWLKEFAGVCGILTP